jgi:hypothetical protein
VPVEEPFDLSSFDDNPLVVRDCLGQLLEIGVGFADKFCQYQNLDFRWELNAGQTLECLLLNTGNGGIESKVNMRAAYLAALKPTLPAQLNKNGMASASKFGPKLLRSHTCHTSGSQLHYGIGQAACSRETDLVVKPQTIDVELRDRAKRVPGSIVCETAVVSNFCKEPTDRWNRVTQLGSQRFDLPAWLLEKNE